MKDTENDLNITDQQDQSNKKGIVDNARESLGQIFDMVQAFLGIKSPTIDFAKYILKESLAQLAGVVKTIADGLTDNENKLDDHKEFSSLYKTFRLLKGLAEGVEKFEKDGVISAIKHIYGAIKEMFSVKDEVEKENKEEKIGKKVENISPEEQLETLMGQIANLGDSLEMKVGIRLEPKHGIENLKNENDIEGSISKYDESQATKEANWVDKISPKSGTVMHR
ncbi:hypothetical protein Cyrtocomes_01127 [Candidatus Cyrtobacter comes]|uniref:Uncharacterized protein n=1 Tax=Candidatus Cyrtobacter comes TaxID=675776 RepID=A0ABU5L9E0_9RICK|nr:hypothetical protein [Candidatus Cyrtobacter comes]MDZ5762733.1 hypothetical protein [Candidatus Cyrtobacter comes]